MSDITSNPFNLPFNAYAAFDATNLKTLMIQRLNEGNVFTDQIYEGSNFNSLLDVIAYSYNVLLFYLNKTASESMFSQAQLYENMNRIVKALNYNPIGFQSSVVAFEATAPTTLPAGVYTIPRYSYFTVNGIPYSFVQDATFIKTTDAREVLTQFNNSTLLYQGIFIPYPLYVANGSPFEEFSLAAVSEQGSNELIDHTNIYVYVTNDAGQYEQWNRVNSLYLEDPNSKSFECRFNENQRYTIKFGNNVNGKQLKPTSVVSVFYLKSDGTAGEIGPNVLDNNKLFLFNEPQFNTIFNDIKTNLTYVNSDQAANLTFINPAASTAFTNVEDALSIRSNAANTFKTQYRLITTSDFETFIKNNFSNVLNDVKVVNNWEYLAEHVRYLYNIGLEVPNNDSRVLFNQVTFADSCDFNNIYVYAVPKLQNSNMNSTKLRNNFLGTGLKDKIINELLDVKMTTSEIVIMDPVYVAVGLGVASNEEISNDLLTSDIISETKLVIGRSPNSRYSENEVKNQAVNILKDYFSVENAKLGQFINLDLLTTKIFNIPGVTSVSCTRSVNGQQITRSGLSLLVFNPVYSEPGEDINVINQSITLPYFKIPYIYNPDAIFGNIEIVTPDSQEASLREY
jgi:hypothetical protein